MRVRACAHLLVGVSRGEDLRGMRGSEKRARGSRIARGAKCQEEGREVESRSEGRRGVALPRVTGWVKSRKEASRILLCFR